MPDNTCCLVTCEHGGNRIPSRFATVFKGHESLLDSHSGYDPGALELARSMASTLGVPILYSTISRLLVELNRSLHNRRLFSEVTRPLSRTDKEWLLQNIYRPYHARVHRAVKDLSAGRRRVVHLSVHSFTPCLDGQTRTADIGLLYDPSRVREADWCAEWRHLIRSEWPQFRVRRNYPYRGRSDGIATMLRRRFPESLYVGIELEVNQCHYLYSGRQWNELKFLVQNSLMKVLSRR